jgi:hypothetical protein
MFPVSCCLLLCSAMFVAHPVTAHAQSASPLVVDARQQPAPPQTGWLEMGTAKNPAGQTITVNSRYLELDGQPWLPVMGEFHYSRYPHQYWEEELLKMKAAGIQVVSFYVIWIHHEEIEGQWDWTGDRDLRQFVQLCQKHGLYAVIRIGPWAHAEVRNGGFPDWVVKQGHTRSTDPRFLASVDTFYRQIAAQVHGLFWKDGGPIVGVQIENEYALNGPGEGEGYIARLKKMAVADGFDVPLYTVTGWDGAVFPAREVVPVFGGYADWPWDDRLTKLPPNEVYSFRFESREGGDMGAPGGRPASHATQAALAPYPFLSAEFGAGIQDTYHRRPVIHASDVAAMLPTQLGSGVNMFGYYMFQGGRNPKGKLTTLQESQVSGSPNDMQIINYDFQAPLGEYGEERESYRKTKLFHYFLNEFGGTLAPMAVHEPQKVPAGPDDFSTSRFDVRSLGDSGFLFVNNYLRGYELPARKNFQVRVRLPGGDVLVPQQPITVPSGDYFLWPINMQVDGVTLRYATAQIITTLQRDHEDYVFAVAQDGIAPEFALALRADQSLSDAPAANVGDAALVRPATGTGIAFTVASRGKPVHFVVLSQQQAEHLTVVELHGRKTVLYSGAYAFSDGESIHFRSEGRADVFFGVLGPDDRPWQAAQPLHESAREGVFRVYGAALPAKTISVTATQMRQAGDAPPIERLNTVGWRKQPVAVAPTDLTMAKDSAEWNISVPKDALDGAEDVFLQLHYKGDVARLYSGSDLLDDDFFNGETWVIGLKRFAGLLNSPLKLQVLPLRADAPVYFDPGYKPAFSGKQLVELDGVTAVPEYELVVSPAAGKP